jgi:hypothetical protein
VPRGSVRPWQRWVKRDELPCCVPVSRRRARAVDRPMHSRGKEKTRAAATLSARKPIAPVGFQNSATASDLRFSGCASVLVEQATEDRSTSDPPMAEIWDGRFGAWWMKVPRQRGPARAAKAEVSGVTSFTEPTGTSPPRHTCKRREVPRRHLQYRTRRATEQARLSLCRAAPRRSGRSTAPTPPASYPAARGRRRSPGGRVAPRRSRSRASRAASA